MRDIRPATRPYWIAIPNEQGTSLKFFYTTFREADRIATQHHVDVHYRDHRGNDHPVFDIPGQERFR